MEEFEEEHTKCQICLNGSKEVAKFTISHLGLLTLVVSYCFLGAIIFVALESEHELDIKKGIKDVRKAVANDLWEMTQRMEYIKPDNWTEYAKTRLMTFESDLVKAMRTDGWDGEEATDKQNWSMLGALFYSIIVITTIGYGNITPKTIWGRIMTMFYAIVGIPLMVVCWSHIGDFMANAFRVIYWKACCYLCTRNPVRAERTTAGSLGRSSRTRSVRSRPTGSIRMKNRSIRRSARVSQRSADSAISADSIHSVASDPGMLHTVSGSMRFPPHRGHPAGPNRNHPHFSTLPRTGHQGKLTGHPRGRFRSEEPEGHSSQTGTKNLPVLFNRYAEDLPSFHHPPPLTEGETPMESQEDEDEVMATRPTVSRSRARAGHHFRSEPHSPRHIPAPEEFEFWGDPDFFEEDEEIMEMDDSDFGRHERRPVPIWLCAFLVISYIVGGAYLFSAWEEWTFLDSAYFCFITLTTIGFGDYVPAKKLQTNPRVSIALCSLYLLFGIALLAMSFNLVQEQVINAFKDLAIRLGIISEEDEDK